MVIGVEPRVGVDLQLLDAAIDLLPDSFADRSAAKSAVRTVYSLQTVSRPAPVRASGIPRTKEEAGEELIGPFG